jgi:hypothetical protein
VTLPELGDVTSKGTLSLRSNYAVIHQRAAGHAARAARAVEEANDTSKLGAWFDELMIHVPVTVVMAAAALEANANEIIQDILDRSLPSPRCTLLKDLLDERTGGVMDKYRRLALQLDKLPDQGSFAWQNADLLVRLRNFFVHFKPAWDHQAGVHEDSNLVKQLAERIPLVKSYQGSMMPYRFLNCACARWAVVSAKTFSADFSNLIGVQDRLPDEPLS